MISSADITRALGDLGVRPDDTLLVHSSLASSLRVEGGSVAAKVAATVAGLEQAVPDGRLLLPTFTYSYCDGEDFDVDRSPSRVGALTEAFRRSPGVRRTRDPLFSMAIRGALDDAWEARLMTARDTDAFGPESVFALLADVDAALLFYGIDLGAATFVHHVEQRLGVPYRYPKTFTGAVIDGVHRTPTVATYLVRDLEADVVPFFAPLERDLRAEGGARSLAMPDGPELLVVRTCALTSAIREGVRSNPLYLLERGHASSTPEPAP